MPEPVVEAHRLTREYLDGDRVLRGCDNVSLSVQAGEFIALRGRSGSGKSTLLRLLGGLDRPSSGAVCVAGKDLGVASEEELVQLRRHDVAFVMQDLALVPALSAAENTEVPLRIDRRPAAERATLVANALESVGLGVNGHQHPAELSGGQQQRVAVARALVKPNRLLLADEPTSQLDGESADRVGSLLAAAARKQEVAVIVATHDASLIGRADRVFTMSGGRLLPT